jgi:RND family efflux transporter MFP subunit
MNRSQTRQSAVVGILLATLAAAGCGQEAPAETKPAAPAVVEVGRENIVAVEHDTISTGPLISGTLYAEHEATVRAEVAGSVLQVTAEEGQPVKRGALLARIEEQTLRDAFASTESAVTSAQAALDVARREATRTENLVKGGALPDRDLENARNAVTAAEAQLANTKSMQASARKTLDNATVTSPMTGIISVRTAHTGDVVSVGGELFKIIDPSSMRLNAAVPAEALNTIKLGLPVEFRVKGIDQAITGKIERVSPMADPVTRQVTIFVTIPNQGGRLVAGLFAEGRVSQQTRKALVVPESAVNFTTSKPWVLKIAGNKAERVDVQVGLRDPQTERVELTAGVAAGDQLLVGASQGLTPGTPVKVRESQAQTPPAAQALPPAVKTATGTGTED